MKPVLIALALVVATGFVAAVCEQKDDHVLFTHDLDFGAILAVSRSDSPSVIQIRTQNLNSSHLVPFILRVLNKCQEALTAGALINVDETSARARVLPLK